LTIVPFNPSHSTLKPGEIKGLLGDLKGPTSTEGQNGGVDEGAVAAAVVLPWGFTMGLEEGHVGEYRYQEISAICNAVLTLTNAVFTPNNGVSRHSDAVFTLTSGPFPQEYAWCCLHFDDPFRHVFILLMEHPLFDATSMIFILMNCVTLSMFDPFDRECITERCETLQVPFSTPVYRHFTAILPPL